MILHNVKRDKVRGTMPCKASAKVQRMPVRGIMACKVLLSNMFPNVLLTEGDQEMLFTCDIFNDRSAVISGYFCLLYM